MTLDELARYLVTLGCREAMNLDGGGSAMMWVGGAVVNSPSDGEERAVSNALILLRKGATR
jgi:exopolysaccharide biosynthesis protein